MIDETRIEELVNMLSDLVNTAGDQEYTKIFPNLEIISTTPTGLSSYIIVKDVTGYYMPALKIPGLTYTVGDYVNVLIIKGSEPVAFGYGSSSTASPSTGTGCVQNELQADLTIADGYTCIRGDTIVPAGITLTVETGGRLVIV